MKLKHSDIDYILQLVDDAMFSELPMEVYIETSVRTLNEIKYKLQQISAEQEGV